MFFTNQDKGNQVGYPIDKKQGYPRNNKILKKDICPGKFLKIRKYNIHIPHFTRRVGKHHRAAPKRTDADKQTPKNRERTKFF